MLRVASVFSGILTFFSEHTDLINRENTLSAMKFFNRVGGARELVAMSDDFFKSELEKKFSNIIN